MHTYIHTLLHIHTYRHMWIAIKGKRNLSSALRVSNSLTYICLALTPPLALLRFWTQFVGFELAPYIHWTFTFLWVFFLSVSWVGFYEACVWLFRVACLPILATFQLQLSHMYMYLGFIFFMGSLWILDSTSCIWFSWAQLAFVSLHAFSFDLSIAFQH